MEVTTYGGRRRAQAGSGSRSVRVRAARDTGGVREVPAGTGPAQGYPRPRRKRAVDMWRCIRTAVIVTLLTSMLVGQVYSLGYTQGTAAGQVEGRIEGQKGQYDRGYAAAVADYREGVATWASE